MSRIHVACAADAVYAPYCAAMLHSLLSSQAGGVTVHFLHAPALAPEALDGLRATVEAHAGAEFRGHAIVDDRFAALPVAAQFGPAMWYRFLLPELLPDQPRVLYLDVDILVVDRLDELWAMPLDGMSLAAADNVIELALRPRLATLGLPPDTGYFNSGVLLLNLERLRQTGATQRLLELARMRGAEFLWPDQDALNLVLGSERVGLHPRWNCQNALYWWRPLAEGVYGAALVAEALARPAIVHFEGPGLAKPWHYLNKHPLRARWRRHMHRTPFPMPPVVGRDAYTIWLRPLPAPLIPYMLRAGTRLRRLWSR